MPARAPAAARVHPADAAGHPRWCDSSAGPVAEGSLPAGLTGPHPRHGVVGWIIDSCRNERERPFRCRDVVPDSVRSALFRRSGSVSRLFL